MKREVRSSLVIGEGFSRTDPVLASATLEAYFVSLIDDSVIFK